jgi:hypothetical protein
MALDSTWFSLLFSGSGDDVDDDDDVDVDDDDDDGGCDTAMTTSVKNS